MSPEKRRPAEAALSAHPIGKGFAILFSATSSLFTSQEEEEKEIEAQAKAWVLCYNKLP